MLLFKLVFLQFLWDLADREMEKHAAFNLVDKWFLGLSVEESPFDFFARCRLRARLEAEGLENCSIRW